MKKFNGVLGSDVLDILLKRFNKKANKRKFSLSIEGLSLTETLIKENKDWEEEPLESITSIGLDNTLEEDVDAEKLRNKEQLYWLRF